MRVPRTFTGALLVRYAGILSPVVAGTGPCVIFGTHGLVRACVEGPQMREVQTTGVEDYRGAGLHSGVWRIFNR